MNDKFKQAFYGKPMTQKQIANWERTRGKGRAMYVARFTLLFGTIAFVVNSLGAHYLMDVPLRARYLLAPALIWYTYGFLVSLYFWSITEKKYREHLMEKKYREHLNAK
jgi:hypothetical protein